MVRDQMPLQSPRCFCLKSLIYAQIPVGNLMTFSLREVGKLGWFKYKSPKGKRSDIVIKIENIPIVLLRCFS
jgi:hypothetical protein